MKTFDRFLNEAFDLNKGLSRLSPEKRAKAEKVMKAQGIKPQGGQSKDPYASAKNSKTTPSQVASNKQKNLTTSAIVKPGALVANAQAKKAAADTIKSMNDKKELPASKGGGLAKTNSSSNSIQKQREMKRKQAWQSRFKKSVEDKKSLPAGEEKFPNKDSDMNMSTLLDKKKSKGSGLDKTKSKGSGKRRKLPKLDLANSGVEVGDAEAKEGSNLKGIYQGDD